MAKVLVRWCAGALVRWCAGALLLLWCSAALLVAPAQPIQVSFLEFCPFHVLSSILGTRTYT
jgi:ABC-type transport system involved in cytochrome c biogenesis permease subunit